MSHVAVYKSTLAQVNVNLLKRAINMAAKTVGGEAGDSIITYQDNAVTEMNGMPIVGAITTRDVIRGIGVTIDSNGKPEFVGDDGDCRDAAIKLQKAVESAYVQIVVTIALQQQGYTVKTQQGSNGVFITGERA